MENINKVMPSTINNTFISIYSKMGLTWWDENAPINIVYRLNEIRIPWIMNALQEYKVVSDETARSQKPLQNLSILDVGCGGGYVTEDLARMGGNVFGIDPCPELIQAAKDHAHKLELSGITYTCETVEEHTKSNCEKYDIVIASQVLAFLNEPELFLKKCVECLKPNGIIFITTFNRTWISWYMFQILKRLRNFSKNIYDYHKFSKPEELKRILAESNCRTGESAGIRFNLFSGKWTWCGSGSMLFALHGRKEPIAF